MLLLLTVPKGLSRYILAEVLPIYQLTPKGAVNNWLLACLHMRLFANVVVSSLVVLKPFNREVPGEMRAYARIIVGQGVRMCKNCSQATGASAAASAWHKESFSLPPISIARIYEVHGGLLAASIKTLM